MISCTSAARASALPLPSSPASASSPARKMLCSSSRAVGGVVAAAPAPASEAAGAAGAEAEAEAEAEEALG